MSLTYDELVNGLTALGVPRPTAEQEARRQLGIILPSKLDQAHDDAMKARLEKDEQWAIIKLFRAFGFVVYSTSQQRAAKVTPGIPDLWCMHAIYPIAFWWETKREQGGKFTTAQREFGESCARCEVRYDCGSERDAREYLIAIGIATDVNGHLEPRHDFGVAR